MDPEKDAARDADQARNDPLNGPASPQPATNEDADVEVDALSSAASTASGSDPEKKIRAGDHGPQRGAAAGSRTVQRTITAGTELSAVTSNDPESVHPSARKPWHKRGLNPLRWRPEPPVPKEREVSREHAAGWLSRLTFQWMAPLMSVGYRRPLEPNDVWLVNPDRRIDLIGERVAANFERRRAQGDRNALLRALLESFPREFIVGGILAMLSNLMQVLSPFVLRYLITFAGEAYYAQAFGTPGPPIGNGIGLVVGVSAMQVIQSLATSHYIYRGLMMGGQSRAALTAMIFDKAMIISARARAGVDVQVVKEGDKEAQEKLKNEKQSFIDKLMSGKADPKNMRLPGAAGGYGAGWSNGRIVNLMSTDTQRIDLGFGLCHLCWTSPIMLLITLVLLLINITYSALAGFALIVGVMPLLTKAIRSLFRRRKKINLITDERVSLTQEILSSVRFVKYFGWESSFESRLNALRKKEIRAIQWLLAIRNAINAVAMTMPVFASMLAFITYSLSQHVLSPAPIFSSLALFNSMRLPLNLLPTVIGQVTDALVSIRRIQDFLEAEEADDETNWDPAAKNGIALKGASFTWERTSGPENAPMGVGKPGKPAKGAKPGRWSRMKGDRRSGAQTPESSTQSDKELEPFRLENIDLEIGRGELVAVIGSVGSGKSSLLAALAGDMRKTEGEVTMSDKRAFCPQYAWIQNTTLRENVLFGKDMQHKWYNTVIEASALRPDIEMLPAGDLTEIGERGITVSGGQKQRLNIARAIYFDRNIVLMDDPLSAVDAHVGRHIFDHAICGLLKGRCRVLATHQLHVLERCDRIIMMDEGRVHAFDTFKNLMASNEAFQTLMATTAQEETEEAEAEEEKDEADEKEKRRKARKGAALMQAEERAVREVPWSVYGSYIRASGSILSAPLVILFLILANGANIVTSLWLSWWVSDEFHMSEGQYIGIYASIGVVQAVFMFLFSASLSVLGTRSSLVLLNNAVKRVLRAPMAFFDTTPLGRITNRFAKDVDILDNVLTDAMRMYLMTLASIVAVFILIIVYFPYFAIALVPLFFLFLFAAGYYRASAREMKRHEAVLRSSVFARFGEGVSGVSSIRAYGLEGHFAGKLRQAVDGMNAAYYLTCSNQRWLSLRLDIIGISLVFTVGILVVTSRFSVNPSIGGLVLSYILSIVQIIQFSVRQLAEMENSMNATERLLYYGNQIAEEAPERAAAVRPAWPEAGRIDFNDVHMRYRPNLPLVLQGFDMHVRGGERIGIVGRTGAGKSTIMSTLFRLTELCDGSISIDGVDIATVGLRDLRTRLAIIPQDPTLFRGTIRSNLDPFHQHTDLELWSALRQADLVAGDADTNAAAAAAAVARAANDPDAPPTTHHQAQQRIHLDSTVDEEGLNFSLGQRQLMALARALVRDARIIVCDEATSSVDFETDQKIQRTIATSFRGRTLLCIAHRLKTIIGYDRICVMDSGRIAELDEPLKLYDAGGIFRGMCERSGIRREDFEAASHDG